MGGSSPGRHRRARRVIALALIGCLFAAACDSGDSDTEPTSTTEPTTTTSTTTSIPNTPPHGPGTLMPLAFSGVRLRTGEATAAAAQPVALAAGEPLDEAAVQAVLDRLPPWDAGDASTAPFNWPAQTIQPPQPGAIVDLPFPATDPVEPVDVPTGPLHVLRTQPVGEVDIAPFVSITFDQPMVPVGTVAQVNGADVPASISPAVPGRWQWIGTSTLRFDADSDVVDRLPMATEYTVTIPAGTTSAGGGVLADEVTWQFSTPPPTVQTFQPTSDSLPLTPVFLAAFDQRVDPAAVLATIVVRAGGAEQQMRLATADEIAADEGTQQVVDALPETRWVAFRPVEPLPADASIDVEIGPGTPSTEGPLASAEPASFSAHTYAPLAIESVECGYGGGCAPGNEFLFTFNNAIDPELFDPSTIRVEPAIDGQFVAVYDTTVSIRGAQAANTTYTVTMPAGLTDVFGQQLGQDDARTIEVGEPTPFLQRFPDVLVTVDPSADQPALTVASSGHDSLRVRVYAADPAAWTSIVGPLQQVSYGDPNAPDFDLPVLSDTTVEVEGDAGAVNVTSIDLSEFMPAAHGHVVVVVEPTESYGHDDPDLWANLPVAAWVQGTDIGVDALVDSDELRAWTTDLSSGAPLPDVTVEIAGVDGSATTDGNGLAILGLPGPSPSPSVLIASRGDDTALLPGYWQPNPVPDHTLWHVFDDRGVYRPGETVSMKGWVRRLTTSGDAQVELWSGDHTVRYRALDGQGNAIAEGEASVNPLGGFDFTFDVPAGANLGYAHVELTLDPGADEWNRQWHHQFQIEEFRRPEFEVTARNESAGPYVRGAPLTVAADAAYYAGGPLGDAPVTWQVTTASATYAPPGWDDFSFGRWIPWWYATEDVFAGDVGPCCFPPGGDEDVATYTGTTDANGSQYLEIAVGELGDDLDAMPVTITAQATVEDVNRQQISSTTNALVHPAALYVGLRGTHTFVERGDPLDIEAIATDIDGNAVAGREVQVTASRTETVYANGTWTDQEVDPQTCTITSAAEPAPCSFTTSVGGTYTVTAIIVDDEGRASRTELTRWVSAAERVPSRRVELEELTIVPNQAEYQPGDTAELLVQSPFETGTGLLTISRNGIVSTSSFDVALGSAVLQVPIADTDIPNLDVSIEVVGSAPRTADDGTALPDAPPRPAFAAGSLTLDISTASRALTVTATPRDEQLQPGATTQLDVTVVDAAGQPVTGGELAVVVVDEAVLALSGYQLGDPLDSFYAHLPTWLGSQYGRQSIVLADPSSFLIGGDGTDDSAEETSAAADTTTAPAGDSDASRSAVPTSPPGALEDAYDSGGEPTTTGSTPIDVRTNFDALAVFAPAVTTDEAGHATIDVPLPDNLTRYRVMVVAVAGAQQFGSAEANITARLPLMVRPSAPRFLNFGDSFELPVIVQNQTGAPMDVDVVVQSANLDPAEATGKRVAVPANDRVEVRFPMSAAQAGTARLRVSAASGVAADSATSELPVYTPATAEAFATYGVIDDGAIVQPVLEPTDVIPQFGGLDVSTSSTSLQALTDAVLYITDYPYESSDARASRILAIVALRDVLDAFDAPGLPSADAIAAVIAGDIDALAGMQNDDGGFPFWQRTRPSEPYNSIQATHALVAARDAGYAIPAFTVDRALQYLRDIDVHILPEYDEDTRDTLKAYALNVRMLAGERDSSAAQALWNDRGEDLPLDAVAWLWPVIEDDATSDAIEGLVGNRAVDTAGSVTFTTDVSDDTYVTLASDRRTDGLLLDALIALRPDSDLIPKVVTGLLASQRQGRWHNVQENSFILLALKRYFDAYESQTPDFVARVWLGQQYAGEQQFAGRSTDRNLITIPTEQLLGAGDADLTIAKEGTGRLYYRIGLRTAPSSLRLDPLDRGFVVARTYEAVDDPSDVTRDADGTWHIRAGARVRMRLTMVAESQRTHVALVDPLPAGLEILNPALATTADAPPDPAAPSRGEDAIWWWYPTWFDHQNLRDDRAEAFATYLPAGTYDYSYVAKATTPGTFVTPPVRAEEIYAPETFGRANTDTIVIS